MFGGSFYGQLVYGSPGGPYLYTDGPTAPPTDSNEGGFAGLHTLLARRRRRRSGVGTLAASPHRISGSGSFISEAHILFLLGD